MIQSVGETNRARLNRVEERAKHDTYKQVNIPRNVLCFTLLLAVR